MMTQNSKRILLVEDDSLVAKIHAKTIKHLGYEVVIASTGWAALLISEEEDFDLILMDMGLPDISGDYIIAGIRHSESERNSQCPIIVLTGYANENIHQRALAAGANKVILKPLSIVSLKQIIETEISK